MLLTNFRSGEKSGADWQDATITDRLDGNFGVLNAAELRSLSLRGYKSEVKREEVS